MRDIDVILRWFPYWGILRCLIPSRHGSHSSHRFRRNLIPF
jgi:hypothetical protein